MEERLLDNDHENVAVEGDSKSKWYLYSWAGLSSILYASCIALCIATWVGYLNLDKNIIYSVAIGISGFGLFQTVVDTIIISKYYGQNNDGDHDPGDRVRTNINYNPYHSSQTANDGKFSLAGNSVTHQSNNDEIMNDSRKSSVEMIESPSSPPSDPLQDLDQPPSKTKTNTQTAEQTETRVEFDVQVHEPSANIHDNDNDNDNDVKVSIDHEKDGMNDNYDQIGGESGDMFNKYQYEPYALRNDLTLITNEFNDLELNIKHEIMKGFIGTKYEKNEQISALWWHEFCSKRDGDVICKQLSLNLDLNKKENYFLSQKWKDYILFRINYFENLLKPMLHCNSNVNYNYDFGTGGIDSSKTEKYNMYQLIEFKRYKIGSFGKRLNALKQLSLNTYVTNSMKYYIMYCCVYDLLKHGQSINHFWSNQSFRIITQRRNKHKKEQQEKPQQERQQLTLEEEINVTEEDTQTFLQIFRRQFCDFFCKGLDLGLVSENDNKKQKQQTIITIDKIMDNEINELARYCLQDIPNPLLFNQRAQGNGKKVVDPQSFIAHRLSWIILNNLNLFENSSDINNNDNWVQLPQLTKLVFCHVWNRGIHTILCAEDQQLLFDEPEAQSYVISIYFALRNQCIVNDNKLQYLLDYQNTRRNGGGTLLHKAVIKSLEYYCQVLVNDGADYNTIKNKSMKRTVLEEARYWKNDAIIAIFNKDMEKQNNVNGSANRSNINEIEITCKQFNNCNAFCRFFLFAFGFELANSDEKELLGITDQYINIFPSGSKSSKRTNVKQNVLYKAWKDLNGIKCMKTIKGNYNVNNNSNMDDNVEFEYMDRVVEVVMSLLERKMVVSEDLLILCFNYCLMSHKYYNQSKLLVKFCIILKNTIESCLDQNSEYQTGETQAFYYQWFKQCLLKSNIWLCKVPKHIVKQIEISEIEANNIESAAGAGADGADAADSDNNETDSMYYSIGRVAVDKALVRQKEFIWQSIENEEKLDSKSWNDILTFKETNLIELRQDSIECGINFESDIKWQDIYTMLPLMDKGGNFDIFEEYNTKTYLTRHLIFAHKMNDRYQNDIKVILDTISKNLDISLSIAKAPVKLSQRCITKASTDYATEPFPTVACIVDFLRCSVTVSSAADMIKIMKQFIDTINQSKVNYNTNDDNKETCIKDIVRIKNGFKNIRDWKGVNDCGYCDIKMNLIIYDEFTNISQIGEIQFLLNWLLKAKKIGHKLYGFARRSEFIDSVNNMIDNDNNYSKYKGKIQSLFTSSNTTNLTQQLIWKPNVVLSMICDKNVDIPIPHLGIILFGADMNDLDTKSNFNIKLVHIYYGCLIHFARYVLNDTQLVLNDVTTNKKDQSDDFLTQYLNFGNCNQICRGYTFWGIDTREMKTNSLASKIIEYIMKNDNFHGLSQISVKFLTSSFFFSISMITSLHQKKTTTNKNTQKCCRRKSKFSLLPKLVGAVLSI